MEILEKRIEVMMKEVEQMVKLNLLTYEECKKILKKRREFEYKVYNFSASVQDFVDYIDYETSLLNLVRRNKNTNTNDQIVQIEVIILKKIKELHELCVERFPDNTAQCISYFKFCKQANCINAASVAVSKLINNHSNNIEVWQLAAKWHAYDRKDIGTGLKILCEGIAKHKQSKLLYTELIHLEMHNTVNSKDADADRQSENQKLCLEKIDTYFKEMFLYIDDYEYFIKLLDYFEEYNFTESIQKNLINYLVERYSSKAVIWNMLAQRDRKGLPTFPYDTKPLVKESTRKKLRKCVQRYKDGLKQVEDSEKEALYSFYINCLSNAKQEEPGVANVLKTKALREAFEAAAAENIRFEKFFLQWLELAESHEKPKIMAMAIARYPKSLELWEYNLKTVMLLRNKDGITKIFRQGIQELQEKALSLWIAYLHYHILFSDTNTVEMIYREALKQPPEVSETFKPDYLEWLATTNTTAYTRQQYFILANQKPYCKKMHDTMFKLETTEIVMNFAVCDRIHDLACEQFGREDVEVWQNRIKYYVLYKKEKASKEAFMQTYAAAERYLPAVLFSDFKDKFFALTGSF